MKLELVTWRDANFALQDDDVETKDFLMRTVGWTSKKGRWLVVRSEKDVQGGWRRITHIPLENVVKRIRLKKGKS